MRRNVCLWKTGPLSIRHLFLLSILGVFVATPAAASHTGLLMGAPSRVTITMTEYTFSPAKITIPAGTPVDFILENKGILPHNFMVYPAPKQVPQTPSEWWDYVLANTYLQNMGEILVHPTGGARVAGDFYIAGTSVAEVGVEAGKRATLTFTPTTKGIFEFACHVGTGPSNHYRAGMKGTLIVK